MSALKIYTVFPRLLAKALIKRAISVSASVAAAEATIQFNRDAYILKVLEARYQIRLTVRTMAAESDEAGQKELVTILDLFEALSDENKAAYLVAYRACATLASQGPIDVVAHQSWDQGHIPPRQEP